MLGKLLANQILNFSPELYKYIVDHSVSKNKHLSSLIEKTDELKNAVMQISPDLGQLLSWLIKLSNAKRTLDVGTFTGHSALVAALAVPDDGEVLTFDIDDRNIELAREHWQAAGVFDKVKFHLGPALEELEALLADQAGSFDFAFIDADKRSYQKYFELCYKLVRPGGVMVFDDTLWGGDVVGHASDSKQLPAIKEFNDAIYKDNRVEITLLPIGNGVTMALKL